MRRPRSKLQVTTFPFLAVLLCAMGSLLLLLFVMDRRAKIAAQHQVAEAVEKRKARSKAEEDERQAEWEKAKAKLHLALLEQDDQVQGEASLVLANLNNAEQKLDHVRAQSGSLQNRIKNESGKIEFLAGAIAIEDVSLKDAAKKEAAAKAEALAAAKELAELEAAFRQLRLLKARDGQTYSLVPYRGKNGDARRPIYVECVRDGVVFQPDAKLLAGWAFSTASIREEVERRHGPLAVHKATIGKSEVEKPRESKRPYVLFLIRPDGIDHYYKAQTALRGYDIDFGYELVDEHWVLDFSGAGMGKTIAANRSADHKQQAPMAAGFPANAGGTVAQGGIAGPLGNERPSGPGTSMRPGGGIGYAGNGGNFAASGAPGSRIGSGDGTGVLKQGGGPGGTVGSRGAFASGGGQGGFASPSTPLPAGPGYRPLTGVIDARSGQAPSFRPIQDGAPPVPIASSGGLQKPTMTGGPPSPLNVSTSLLPRIDSTANSPTGGNGEPNGGNARTGNGTPNSGNAAARPANANSNSGEPNGGNARTGNGTPNSGNAAARPANANSNSGDPNAGAAPTSPFARPLPGFGAAPSKRLGAPPLPRLQPSRDFVITIDCRSDVAIIRPGGATFRWTDANAQATDRAVAQSVANLIARRQDSVRPGEPRFRPVIRFQVQPNGLRTYYHVYPLLEPLRVPMTRENILD